ncbi:MAG TPA: type II secretion system F family protein [Sedimentisphaerales bacterium]|nr:type II secretion system F family protein [Sedimentisphaerales bacterium]
MAVLATETTETLDETVPAQTPDQAAERRTVEPFNRLHAAKVKQAELILFTTQLAVMLDSGVALSDAIDAIAEQTEPGTFKMIIVDVAETIKSGENFSAALTDYPKVFNSMFISMVKASEASGRMVEMLRVISGYLNFEADTRKRIKGALTYPFIMALMAVVATGTLMFFVLPRFMKIYEARGATLPKITQVLVSFSKVLGDFKAMTTIVTAVILASAALYYWAQTSAGRRVIDFIKIRTPVLGTMFIDMVVTRSMRIMATMVSTGVSLLDSVEVIGSSCENYYFQRLWAGTDEKIRDGYQLSESILISMGGEGTSLSTKERKKKRNQLIAPGVIQMLRAGEKSGKLGEVCDKISAFYEKKLEASIRSVTVLIEPLMITILGAIIGTISIALLLPVFNISSVIAH